MPTKVDRTPAAAPQVVQERSGTPQETVPGWEGITELGDALPSSGHGYALWAILGLVAALITWACLAEINVNATAPGKVVPEGKVKILQAADSATVRAIHVKEGQRVKTGDLLVELDPTINAVEQRTIDEKRIFLRLEVERIQAELDKRSPVFDVPGALPESILLQEALLASRRNAYAAKRAEASSTRHQRLMLEAGAEATLKKIETAFQTAREREERVRPYIGVAMPYFDYLKLKDNASNLESELAAQQNVVHAARQERLAAEQRLRLLEADHRSALMAQIHEKKALIAALTGELIKTGQLLAQKALRSPADGQVQYLSVNTNGGVVTPGQTVATIVPDDAQLVVEAVLSNEDIGHVRLGQAVDIKIDTFPFQKYGTLPGEVTWISPDAEPRSPAGIDPTETQKSGDISRVPGKSGLMYRIRIKPAQSALAFNDRKYPLTVGMTVQADIVTDRRRIIAFFLAPVVKHWDEGTKIR